ncbi:MAG: radical SAM protein [Firmicutes bacterium]|nr:radical SAM protein [Bacillota bacterium]
MYKLLYADGQGCMFDAPLGAVGRTGDRLVEIMDEDVIPLPPGATLVLLPGGIPAGIAKNGAFKLWEQPAGGGPVHAVGALLPQGYTRTLLPGYRRRESRPLPLMGYAAVAWRAGGIYVAALPTDNPEPWDPAHYNSAELEPLVAERLAAAPQNRLLKHLAHCALEYRCYTAQNIFYARWEGGLPISPTCNARCLGCISKQPAQCCPAPQSRLDFSPTVEEAAEVALHHLQHAAGGIISFGQGCEGEPALAAEKIAVVIKSVRRARVAGTVNMNSNAGYTEGVARICDAGLHSIRVSLISARAEIYNAYYRPRDYRLADVVRSIRLAREQGVYVALNLLVLPGLNDLDSELQALVDLISQNDVNQVQLRNLNIDPDYFWAHVGRPAGKMLGIPYLIGELKKIRGLAVGSFTHPVA